MHPALVRRFVLPRMLRRTWPELTARRGELEASQWESAAQHAERQVERLRTLLGEAAKSPFHGPRIAAAGLADGGLRSLADLRRLPILEKQDLKDRREDILVAGGDWVTVTACATRGTTGAPTRYYWDDRYWCLSSAVTQRAYGFLGFEPGDRHAMIWGTAFHQSWRARAKETWTQRLRNLLVIPGFELSEERMGMWAKRLARHRPKVVEGYTSLLLLFGGFLLRNGIRDIRPKAVVSSAEKIYPWQREFIERAFGAPVYDRYGTREVGCIGAECPSRQGLHLSSEHVIVEVVRGNEPVPVGESGELVITCLSNRVFPFLRYRIGDLGRLLSGTCECGRGLARLELTEGRVHDLLTTAHGTYLPGEFFPHLFKEYAGVHSFNIHQRSDKSVHVRVVKTPAWAPEQEASWTREIQKVMGNLPLSLEYVPKIEATAAGKLRFTSSDVPVDLVNQAKEMVGA